MESAKELAEQYFVESSGACESLAKHIQARDAAIRAECAERAVKCFLTAMAESGLSTGNEYAVLVIFDKIRAAIMGGKP